MSGPHLTTLPPELLLKIRSYLDGADLISLNLSSRRFYATHPRQPWVKSAANSFWKMISLDVGDYELQQRMRAQWNLRLKVVLRIRHWIERVIGDNAMRALQDEDTDILDYIVTWEICVGCACYKVENDDWKDGWEFEDKLDEDISDEQWSGEEWEILRGHAKEGRFCKSCCQEWEKVGVY